MRGSPVRKKILRKVACATLIALGVMVAYAGPALADTVVPALVREVQTSTWSPPSPDPMGITYQASTGRLLVVDSEVEEMSIWQNVNFWETNKAGSVQRTSTTWGGTQNFSNEPTGVAIRPSNGHLFISDDVAHKLWDVTLGGDGLFGTSDDSVTSTPVSAWGSGIDLEDLAFGNGLLFLTDAGTNNDVLKINPGSNGRFDGVPPAGDDTLTRFDTAAFGQTDPEALAYNTDAGTLFIGSRKVKFISEVTLSGSLVRTYDASSYVDFKSSSGIAYGPSSDNANARSIYVVDRHVDNDSNPSENDGTLFEFRTQSAPSNNPPVVTNPGNQSNNEGASVSLQVAASDLDGDTLSYGASGLPAGLSINSSTGLISGTVSNTASNSSPYSTSVTASDASSSDTKNFTWTITDATSPVVTNPGNKTNNEGDSVNFLVAATDADGDALTWSAASLPAGLSINTSTGRISGTISAGASLGSPYSSSVTAGDGHTSDTKNFTWTVGVVPPPNDPPVVTNPGTQSNAEGASVSLQVVATDSDGPQALTYSASGLPAGLSINTSTGEISGTVSSTAGASSPYSSSVTASDGQGSDTENFTWTVTDPTTPVVTAPGDKSNNEGASVNLQISASDGDNDTLTYSASGLPPGLAINASTGAITGTISAGAASNSPYSSSVTAGDGSSSDTENFSWAVNGPPVVTNPGARSNDEGDSVSVQIVATDPNPGDTLTYSATGLPDGLTIDTSTGLISGTISAGAGSGSPFSAQVSASDGSLSDTESFTWTINGPPGVPTGLTIDPRTTGLFLDWDDNTDADLAGYNVYRSPTSGGTYTQLNTSVITTSQYDDTTAPANAVSYYRVKAIDTTSTESGAATANAKRSSVVFVGVATNQGSGTSLKVNKPQGTAQGDTLLAVIAARGAPTVTAPAGWTLIREQADPGSVIRQVVFSHVAGASEPSSYTFTLASKKGWAAQILTYRGVSAVGPSDGQSNASSTSITAPSLTAASGDSVEVGFFATAAPSSITPPASMFERGEAIRSAGSSSTRVGVETCDDVVVAGSIGPRTATAASGAVNIGQVLLLLPAP
jgi:putative Ig domain-containing protein